MDILVLDNYDSFTYNLVHYIESIINKQIDVYRNNEIELSQVNKYDKILLSPGPGVPKDAGVLLDLIKKYSATKSILGVCLGHQAIAEAFGGKLVNLNSVFHGVATSVQITKQDKLFNNIPEIFMAGRYHSWIVEKETIPSDIEIICQDSAGSIMALRHKYYDVKGLQFHPESILTEYGSQIIRNWIYDN